MARSTPFQSSASVIDDCMGRDRRSVSMATTYQTDMVDHGPKPQRDQVDPEYIEKNMNPFKGVLSKGGHIKMAGDVGKGVDVRDVCHSCKHYGP